MNMKKPDTKAIDINRIMKMIPHRYPILLVDRVLECVAGEHIVALKNVTVNEPHFQGHFPDFPVMPGVLIVEALAQASALMVVETFPEDAPEKLVYFMGIDNARFRKPIVPGDTIHLHVKKLQSRANVWKFEGEAKVDDVLCAEATFSAMIFDKEKQA